MNKTNIKANFQSVRSFGALFLSVCLLVAIAIWGWRYQSDVYSHQLDELQQQKQQVSELRSSYIQLDTNSQYWLERFELTQQLELASQLEKFDQQLNELDDETAKLEEAYMKNRDYWVLLSGFAVQLNLLKQEASSTFYPLLDQIATQKNAASVLEVIARLPAQHESVIREHSDTAFAALKRDLDKLVTQFPDLKVSVESYSEFVSNYLEHYSQLSTAIADKQIERHGFDYEFLTLLVAENSALSTQLQNVETLKHKLDQILFVCLAVIGLFLFWQASRFSFRVAKQEKLVAAGYRSLQKRLRISEEAEIAKANFLAVISYEARTALDTVMGLTRYTRQKSHNNDQQQKLSEILEASSNLNSLLDDVLELIDFDFDVNDVEREFFSPKAVIQVIDEKYQAECEKKNILFESSVDSSLSGVCLGDQKRFYQLLDYLLSGSLNFTERGHISLSVQADSSQTLNRGQQRINFVIEDTGIQPTSEELGRLFDTYSMTKFKTSRKSGKEGVRLSIIKYLIRLMEGDIEATIKGDQGMRYNFFLLLDIDESGAEPASTVVFKDREEEHTAINVEKLNVLIVEDNKTIAFLFEWILKGLEHNVTIASNGIECLNILESQDFDLIFMDQYMPEMNGEEATKVIRGYDNEKANIPIIGCTADAFQETRQQLIESGQNDVINKPIRNESVAAVIRKLLNGEYQPPTQPETEGRSE